MTRFGIVEDVSEEKAHAAILVFTNDRAERDVGNAFASYPYPCSHQHWPRFSSTLILNTGQPL
jgi:hypothetical protein